MTPLVDGSSTPVCPACEQPWDGQTRLAGGLPGCDHGDRYHRCVDNPRSNGKGVML